MAELTRAQVSAGHDVRVLFRFGDGGLLAAPSDRVDLPGRLASVRGLEGTTMFSAAAAKRARRLERADVVHAHGDMAEAWFFSRYARWVGVPLVLTVHGGLNDRYQRVARHAFAGVDAFIALGDRVRSDLLRRRVPDERITVMSSGLNTGLLDEARRTAVRAPGLVVVVGSLDPVKNVETVVRAVLTTPPESGIVLDVIGDGTQRAELETLVAGSPRVRFLGQLSRSEVYRRVASADTFVIASRRLRGKGEGVPTALLEAMYLGRAALVSTAATPQPVVTDDGSYRTFDPGDSRALASLLVETIGDPESRARLGERARRAVAHLAWPDIARRIDDIYAWACERRH